MYRKRRVDSEIERRIAERDRLLLSAQKRGDHPASVDAREARRITLRINRLESALTRLLDAEWLAAATREEIVAHAVAALDEPLEEDISGSAPGDSSAA